MSSVSKSKDNVTDKQNYNEDIPQFAEETKSNQSGMIDKKTKTSP